MKSSAEWRDIVLATLWCRASCVPVPRSFYDRDIEQRADRIVSRIVFPASNEKAIDQIRALIEVEEACLVAYFQEGLC